MLLLSKIDLETVELITGQKTTLRVFPNYESTTDKVSPLSN